VNSHRYRRQLERDRDFLEGYGGVVFHTDVRRRVALYRIYLYTLMIVETAPRGYQGAEHDQVMALTSQHLVDQLDILR
jgi:hypothetical protein